jgi:hypothetical protein
MSYTPSSEAVSYIFISGRQGSPERFKAFFIDLPPVNVMISLLNSGIQKFCLTIRNKHSCLRTLSVPDLY